MRRKNIEVREILEKEIQDETYIKTVLFAAETNFNKAQMTLQKEYVSKRDDETKKVSQIITGSHTMPYQ